MVTGGAGFIGSHVVDALVERGDSVVILDDLSTGGRENVEHHLEGDQVQLVVGSVLDQGLVESALLFERTGSSSGIRYVPFDAAYEEGFEDLQHRVPDTNAVRDAIGWEAERTIDDAVTDVIADLSRRPPEDAAISVPSADAS